MQTSSHAINMPTGQLGAKKQLHQPYGLDSQSDKLMHCAVKHSEDAGINISKAIMKVQTLAAFVPNVSTRT